MSVWIIRTSILLVVVVTAWAMAWRPEAPALFGFTQQSAAAHTRLERRFMAIPSAERLRDTHRLLTNQPHIAGSERDRDLAEWMRQQFTAYGLEEVRITTHEVLLPRPEEVIVEMTAPRAWRASMREDPVPGDPYTHVSPDVAGLPYHAYSASGEVTAPVVYAGHGHPADYDYLAG